MISSTPLESIVSTETIGVGVITTHSLPICIGTLTTHFSGEQVFMQVLGQVWAGMLDLVGTDGTTGAGAEALAGTTGVGMAAGAEASVGTTAAGVAVGTTGAGAEALAGTMVGHGIMALMLVIGMVSMMDSSLEEEATLILMT